MKRLQSFREWLAEKHDAHHGPRTFRERFLHMMGRDDPPEVVAASFAVGVAISFTPLFGFHIVIALVLAFLLRLNKVDIVLGTLVVNPITIGPVSAIALPLGRFLLRARREAVTRLPWHELFTRSFWHQAAPAVRAIGVQWAVGMFALSFLVGALVYAFLLAAIRRHRQREAARRVPTDSVPAPTGDARPPDPPRSSGG